MAVRRIVANIATPDIARATVFYRDVLGLSLLMDHGWIATYGNETQAAVQISFVSEGGNGTPVPDLSIEVDNVDTVLHAMQATEFEIVYGPVNEPWGVRRFHVHDPFGRLVNILSHA